MPTTLDSLDLSFPPLPQTLLRALELTHDPDGPAPEDVTEMVERDPAAAARLLRVANSAFYGQHGRIHDVERAITILGAAPVVGLVMSMGIAELRTAIDERSAGPFLNLIRHSIATGFLARHLVQRAPEDRVAALAGEAFAAGLLHDIGKLALLYNFPDEAAPLYHREAESVEALREEEQRCCGCDHLQAGLHFARRFRLPLSLRQVLARGEDAGAEEVETEHGHLLLCAVTVASRAADAMDHAFNRVANRTDPAASCEEEMQALGFDDTDEGLALLKEAEEEMASYVGAVL